LRSALPRPKCEVNRFLPQTLTARGKGLAVRVRDRQSPRRPGRLLAETLLRLRFKMSRLLPQIWKDRRKAPVMILPKVQRKVRRYRLKEQKAQGRLHERADQY